MAARWRPTGVELGSGGQAGPSKRISQDKATKPRTARQTPGKRQSTPQSLSAQGTDVRWSREGNLIRWEPNPKLRTQNPSELCHTLTTFFARGHSCALVRARVRSCALVCARAPCALERARERSSSAHELGAVFLSSSLLFLRYCLSIRQGHLMAGGPRHVLKQKSPLPMSTKELEPVHTSGTHMAHTRHTRSRTHSLSSVQSLKPRMVKTSSFGVAALRRSSSGRPD